MEGEASGRRRERRLAVRASAVVLVGQGGSQFLRLASNLVLTRLLSPDLFGLMALINVVNQGVRMFSDVGLRGNVVHHPRGDDPVFLDTVFSVQAVRGVLLWFVVLALAWPAAAFYDAPELRIWIPVVGLTGVLGGLQSTALYSVVRRVQPARRVALDLIAQLLSVGVMVVWAWLSPGLAALVAGNFASALIALIGSHVLLAAYRNRFRLEREALRDIFRFGRWILLSTALTFVIVQGDRLVLGRLLDPTVLGIYSIAAMLSMTIVESIGQLAANVLFPLFARLARNRRAELAAEAARLRLGVLALGLPPLWLLAVFGPELVSFLYDPRYADAGWMARILAIGGIASVLTATQERLLLALGRSDQHMGVQLVGAVSCLGGLALGGAAGGTTGALVGLSAGRWVGYVALVGWVRRHGLWVARVDLAAIGVSVLAIVGGLAFRNPAWW